MDKTKLGETPSGVSTYCQYTLASGKIMTGEAFNKQALDKTNISRSIVKNDKRNLLDYTKKE